MVMRARSLAVLAMAAMPLPAFAGTLGSPTPSFMCDGSITMGDGSVVPAVSGINWGDGSAFGAPIALVGDPTAVEFSCSNNMYSAGIQGNNFAVNFGAFAPSDQFLKYELKYELKTFDYKVLIGGIDALPCCKYFSNFDIYIDFLNTDGVVQYKEFVGLKLDSAFGYASGGDLKLMADGSVVLDPSIPGGFGTLELYDTPAVPEPASLLLVGSGVASAAGVLRRKRKARA